MFQLNFLSQQPTCCACTTFSLSSGTRVLPLDPGEDAAPDWAIRVTVALGGELLNVASKKKKDSRNLASLS